MATAKQRQSIATLARCAGPNCVSYAGHNGDHVPARPSPIAKLYKLHRAAEAAKLLYAALVDLGDTDGAAKVAAQARDLEEEIRDHVSHTKAPTVTP